MKEFYWTEDAGKVACLDVEVLGKWKKRLRLLASTSSNTPLEAVWNYYAYLENHNHFYGNLMLQAYKRRGFAAKLAEQYLLFLCNEDRALLKKKRRSLIIQLAQQDIDKRLENGGNDISPAVISDYHYEILKKVIQQKCEEEVIQQQFQENWQESLLWQFPELVFGLMGYMGSKKVFAQANLVHRVASLLTDKVARQTILNMKGVSAVLFLKNLLEELEGIELSIDEHNRFSEAAHHWIQVEWTRCFNLIDNAAILGENILTDVTSQLTDELIKVGFWQEKPSYTDSFSQLRQQCCRIVIGVNLFKVIIANARHPFNLLDETKASYLAYYKIQEISPDMQKFIEDLCQIVDSGEIEANSSSASTPIQEDFEEDEKNIQESSVIPFIFDEKDNSLICNTPFSDGEYVTSPPPYSFF